MEWKQSALKDMNYLSSQFSFRSTVINQLLPHHRQNARLYNRLPCCSPHQIPSLSLSFIISVNRSIRSVVSDYDISSPITASEPPPPPQETIMTPTSAPPTPMEESVANPSPNTASSPSPITFSIWPPSQRTRDAVIARLIETLSTPSVLSKRYGTLPPEEASEAARSIEEEAFNAAGGASTASPDEEGLQILQIYSKEISKRMLDSVKAHSAASEGGEAPVVNEKAAAEEEADSEVKAEA